MTKTVRFLFYVALPFFSCACTASLKDEVLFRAEEASSPPDWAEKADVFSVADGQVYLTGTYEMPVTDGLPATGYLMAQRNAERAFSGVLEERLKEMKTSLSDAQIRDLADKTANGLRPVLRRDATYWEKVSIVTDADGTRDLIYRVFVRLRVPAAYLKRAVTQSVQSLRLPAKTAIEINRKF